jgi:hypothetical protein
MVLVALAAMVVIGGCNPVTLFLEPIESRKVRIREDSIIGQWTGEQFREFFDDDWTVEVDGGRGGAYTITMKKMAFEPGEIDEITFTGYLVTLGERTWIDIVQRDALLEKGHRFTELPDTLRRHLLPVHIVGRIDLESERISVEWLDAEWLKEYLEGNPADLESLEESILVISDRETVQNFLIAHGKDWDTCEEPWIFERVGEEKE